MPHVDLKRLKLQKHDSNISEDSSSGFKDSGIERDDGLANSSSDIQQDFPSLQSSSAIEPSEPSGGGCTCLDVERQVESKPHMKVILSPSGQPVIITHFDQKLRDLKTLKQHYYPEGGWGWIVALASVLVNILAYGLQLSLAIIFLHNLAHFSKRHSMLAPETPNTTWLGALSSSVSLLMSPVTIAVCKRKSTRLVAVAGGLVTSLGCLFTSFASQWHQVFISYGLIIGVGVGMILDSTTLMIGQYFKRRRELLEIVIVSARGTGLCLLYSFVRTAIRYFIFQMFSKWPFKDSR